jgi:hypothetical protein
MKNLLHILLATGLILLSPTIRSGAAHTLAAVTVSKQERVEVFLKDLPEKVRASVGHGTPTGWIILKAYLVTLENKSQHYDLYVQKNDEETWMKVDKDGQVLN